MSLSSAFAPAEVAHRNQVTRQTFGHLAPSPRKKYKGSLIFTQSEFGELVPIRVSFEGLPDSPWLHQHLLSFVEERATEPGKVYKFEGSYMVFLNGNPSFKGAVTEIQC